MYIFNWTVITVQLILDSRNESTRLLISKLISNTYSMLFVIEIYNILQQLVNLHCTV